jgi:signal peptidase II
MKDRFRILLFLSVAILFIGCDKVSKNLAKEHLMDQPSRSYFHDMFVLEYAENTGAFLGLGDSLPRPVSFWIFGVLPLISLLLLLFFILRKSATLSNLALFAFALILAGGLGNIIDRLVNDRHVTDFMNLGINNLRTGIFNFADVYISTGAVLLLFAFGNKNENTTPTPIN